MNIHGSKKDDIKPFSRFSEKYRYEEILEQFNNKINRKDCILKLFKLLSSTKNIIVEESYSIKSWNRRRIIEKLRLWSLEHLKEQSFYVTSVSRTGFQSRFATSWRLEKKNLTPGFLFFFTSHLVRSPAPRGFGHRNWSSPTAPHELSRTRSHSTGSNRGPDFFARKKPSCWAILSWPANWKAARENGHATGRYRSRPSRAGSTSSRSTSG